MKQLNLLRKELMKKENIDIFTAQKWLEESGIQNFADHFPGTFFTKPIDFLLDWIIQSKKEKEA